MATKEFLSNSYHTHTVWNQVVYTDQVTNLPEFEKAWMAIQAFTN